MAEEILALSTIVKRPTIKITWSKHPRGKLYELINLADLGVLQLAEAAQIKSEVDRLANLKRLTTAQKTRAGELRDQMVRMIVRDIEKPALAEMTDEQKDLVIVAWSMWAEKKRPGAAEGNRAARRRKPSPSSQRS